MEMLVDTGCSYTLVQRRLIPDDCLQKGESVSLHCAHGDITEYPVAEVEMVIEGVTKKVTVVVSNSLPRAVLAGTGGLKEFGEETVENCIVMTRS